ncbi:inactive pancreatic lipase-related protein 1-like isoform X2 [Oculina patagonica]
MHQRTAATFIAFLLVSFSLAKEVCYTKYGCFNDNPPFDDPSVPLPQPPSAIGITYKHFTRAHSATPRIIDDSDVTKLKVSGYDDAKTTIIIVHGFNEHSRAPWLDMMKDKLLKRDDFNIIIVDWSIGAKAPYEQAAGNTHMVGAQMAELIRFLVSSTNATYESFYFVGFGLGAHVAGFAGKKIVKLEGTTLGRITGLDPSGKYFEAAHPDARLDSSDAQFVDVIHSDSEDNGLEQPLGHIDFYPNGGEEQKGCGVLGGIIHNDFCDHRRAREYFIESILSKCPFRAFPCENMAYFERGWCILPDEVYPSMGFNADKSKGLTTGKHLLLTNSRSPFCVYHYTVSFKTGTGLFATFTGRLTVRIYGKNGDTGDIHLNRRQFLSATLNSFVVTFDKDLGTLTKLKVRHDGIPLITQWKLDWAVVKPAWGWDSNYFSACFNSYLSSAGGTRLLHKGRAHKICKS